MSDNWTSGFSFIQSPTGVVHTVGGREYTFYPATAMTLLKLKGIVGPVSNALAVLFEKRDGDNAVILRQGKLDQGAENFTEQISEATPKETILIRSNQRKEAVNDLIKSLTDSNNLISLGEIILDSIRSHFPANQRPPASEFVSAVPLNNLVEFLIGVSKANEGIFGPLGLNLNGLTQRLQSGINQAVAQPSPVEEIQRVAGTENARTG